jgi:hypothetical protein
MEPWLFPSQAPEDMSMIVANSMIFSCSYITLMRITQNMKLSFGVWFTWQYVAIPSERAGGI